MQRGRREVPVLVVLATAWLMVQGVVGAATSGNSLRASHLTLDQYSPLPPYRHGLGLGLYGRRSNDGNSQPEDEQQVNRKVEDDFPVYRSIDDRHRPRDSSIASISANDFPIVAGSYDVNVAAGNPGEPSQRIVPSETMARASARWRSKNFAGSKESGKEGVDYAAAPPSEMDEPFVADERFRDEGPGSVEIYKLDLFEEKKALASGTPTVKEPVTVGTVPVATVTMRTTNNNKSKVPKKSSRLAWKLGKSTSGAFKSTTSGTTRMMVTTGKDNSKDSKDGKNLLHGRSSFSDSELRSEAPPNGVAFGVGGVPELQVGCEGLEAPSSFSSSSSSSAYFSPSRKLRRSVEEPKNGTRQGDSPTALDIVPISLNLDYDWSGESYEEMDELWRLKKLESEAGKRKEHRGDMDPMLHDFFNKGSNAEESLPVRGDLGSATARAESIKRQDIDGAKLRRERRSAGESASSDSDSSGYVSGSRRLLWTEDRENDSDLWGYGEDEGILSSDGLDTDERRRHQEDDERVRPSGGRGRNKYGRNAANTEIDKIREEYDRLLEKERREEEERLRKFKQIEATRSSVANDRRDGEEVRRLYEERMRMEERRREEARKRLEEEEKLRTRNPEDSRRNLTPEDRKSYEEKRREWMVKRRQQEESERRKKLEEERRRGVEREEVERRRVEEERRRGVEWEAEERRRMEEERRRGVEREAEERRRMEEERRRQEEARNAPSNLMRPGYPYDRRNDTREQGERMRLERERKLSEDRERERSIHMNRHRYGNNDSMRRRMEEERRYRPEQERSRNNVTQEEEYRRRMEDERRWEEERRREEEKRREEERRRYEARRRTEQQRSRNSSVTQNSTDEEYQRRLEEHRRRVEEDRIKLEAERKLQEYVRRNQPIDLRIDERRNVSYASRRRGEEEEEQRKAIEAVGQLNRSRYPGSPSEGRQHGPSAPTYIDPRSSLDESRRRQEMEASLQRQRQEEERRREEEYRRKQSMRYEEERKRAEANRRGEERRRQYTIEEQRERAAAMARARETSRPGTRQDSLNRGEQRTRQDTDSLLPANLRLGGNRREMERERVRQEQDRRRQEDQDNEKRRHESRLKAQREREEYMRGTKEQRRRQEEARLNALPVSARIIVRAEGSPPHSRPSFTSRAGFANEIDFPYLNPNKNGPKASHFPAPPTEQPLIESPSPCVWAVVQCCPANTNRLVTCFESLGCPGVNWDPNPCRGAIADAARDKVMRFYAAAEEENRY